MNHQPETHLDGGTWMATCPCGWHSHGWAGRIDAEDAGARHVQAMQRAEDEAVAADAEAITGAEIPDELRQPDVNTVPTHLAHLAGPEPSDAEWDQGHAYAVDLLRQSACFMLVAARPDGQGAITLIGQKAGAVLEDGRPMLPGVLTEAQRRSGEEYQKILQMTLEAHGFNVRPMFGGIVVDGEEGNDDQSE